MTASTVEILDGLEWPFVYVQQCEALAELNDEEVEQIERVAAEFLWQWTGQRFGLQSLTATFDPSHRNWWCRPSTFEGRGPRSTLIAPPSTFHHADPKRRYGIRIRDLQEVTGIVIDGEPFTEYEVYNGVIYRVDGKSWFERDLALEVTIGNPVPFSGRYATGLLACELAKAAIGDADCQLPARLQTVTREGVSIAVMDQFEDLEKGHTGIWMVDQWVASITHAPRSASVISPDYASRGIGVKRSW